MLWSIPVILILLYSNVTWVSLCLESSTIWLFIQQPAQADIKRNIQSSRDLLFVKEIQLWQMDSPHKRPVIWKAFPCCDVVMYTTLIARFMGPTLGSSGAAGPRWAPCWPHEVCYLGSSWNFTAQHAYDVANWVTLQEMAMEELMFDLKHLFGRCHSPTFLIQIYSQSEYLLYND